MAKIAYAMVLAAVLIGLVGCSGASSGPGATPPSDSSAASAPASATVEITASGFSPTQVAIKAGGTVTWTNETTIPHTVSAGDLEKGGFDSGFVQKGKSFSNTFDTPRTFEYLCGLHGERGTLEVR